MSHWRATESRLPDQHTCSTSHSSFLFPAELRGTPYWQWKWSVWKSFCIVCTSVLMAPKACWRLWISRLESVMVANTCLNNCVSTSCGGRCAWGNSIFASFCPSTLCYCLCCSCASFTLWFAWPLCCASNVLRLMKRLGFSGSSPSGIVIPEILQISLIKLGSIKELRRSSQAPTIRICSYMKVARSILCPRTIW